MSQDSASFAVVVWGGGTGGVAAALQAARSGASTLLLTPGPWLGGMVSAAGVCCPDGNELTPWQTGLWGALLRALAVAEPQGLDHNWVSCFGYRPSTAEALLQRWVKEQPRLTWWPGVTLDAVERQGPRIQRLRVHRAGAAIQVGLEVLIDGSDRGDLLPLLDVPYRFGWEPQEQWQEPSAPPQTRLESDPFFRQQPVQSPTWVVMGQLRSDQPPADSPVDWAGGCAPPLPAPFEQACAAFGLERTITYGRLPGGLVMLNWPLHGNDWHDDLRRAFSGDPAEEHQLAQAMQEHSRAFATALIEASDGWLQPGEAFPGGGTDPSLALMPYWREGRRLIGQALVVEQDLLPMGPGQSLAALPCDGAGVPQSIAVGNYANDHHYPGPDWPLAPKSCRWGGRWSGTPFCIPFGALVSAELDNLLMADKAFSCSHMANGATRLQPLILNIGQAAGAAAALAVQRQQPSAAVPVRSVQELLLRDPLAPSAVVPLWDTPWHHPQWLQRQLAVLDDPAQLLPEAMAGSGADASPPEVHERLWQGTLTPDGRGGYSLELQEGARRIWPVITLEPAMHHWLAQLDRPRHVALVGCANPWGPWLRVSRLAA